MAITAADIEKAMARAIKQIEDSANKPDTFSMMKSHIRALDREMGRPGLRKDLIAVLEDESIPDNALCTFLR